MLFAPRAMLFEFNFAFNFALVFARPVIDALAFFALKFDKIILTHSFLLFYFLILLRPPPYFLIKFK